MRALRHWSVRRARFLETIYRHVDGMIMAAEPVLRRIGYDRLEKPAAVLERLAKGALFDCRMCGQCILSSTGMSCPMNCPKTLRNGPCGGVHADGSCEVVPSMRCVWVEAWEGSRRMRADTAILAVQPAIAHNLAGTSAWLARLREQPKKEVNAAAWSTRPHDGRSDAQRSDSGERDPAKSRFARRS